MPDQEPDSEMSAGQLISMALIIIFATVGLVATGMFIVNAVRPSIC